MKIFTLRCLVLPALLLAGMHIQAQDTKAQKGVMVIQQITHSDGSLEIVKKRVAEGEDLNQYLNSTEQEGVKEVRIHIVTDEGSNVWVTQGDNQSLRIHKKEFSTEDALQLQEELGQMSALMREQRGKHAEHFNFAFKGFDKFGEGGSRPILGIYPNDEGSSQGLGVSSLVSGGGAEAAGLQGGDVITTVDGKNTKDGDDLRTALSSHKVGDQVVVQYVRQGQSLQTTVTLGAGSNGFSFKERNPCDVFIGVYTGLVGPEGRGMRISGVIDNTPAAAGGLQEGDVILALDDVSVNSHGELLRERDKHKAGDWFTLRIQRGNTVLDVDAQFKACDQETKPEEVVAKPQEEVVAPLPSTPALAENNTLELEEWNAYPNPTYGPLNVKFRGEAVPTDIQITDAFGKVVYREQQRQFDGFYNKEINLGGNAPGVYLITVRQGDQLLSEKIVLMPKA